MTSDLYANTPDGPATFSRCEGPVLSSIVEAIVKDQPGSTVFEIDLRLAMDGYGVGPRAIRGALGTLIEQDRVRGTDEDRPHYHTIEPQEDHDGGQ